MDFVTAEEKFQELQARIRRGEPMSEDQYQEELAKLMVQDDHGVFWSLEPGTGRWLYFNETEWVPGTPPVTPPSYAPPPAMPPATDTAAGSCRIYAGAAYPSEPSAYTPPAYDSPGYDTGMGAAAAGAYVASELNPEPSPYAGQYPQTPAYQDDPYAGASSYPPLTNSATTGMDPDAVPQYVRMPEPDTANVASGGIPPRPVREASPLAVPGGDRPWLPFAFGALVLLLCAVVLFFGVRGLPQFSGATAGTEPTEEPTEEVIDVLPTPTFELEPTDVPEPTVAPTQEPQPTVAPQTVTATTTEVLNIREGPARTTTSLGKLQRGQTVTVIGRNGDATWLQIQRPDATGTGWVSAEFVTVSGDVNSLPVVSGESGTAPPTVTETPTG